MGDKQFECSAVMNGCEIELTNYCGLDCFGCIRKQSVDFGFLDKETLQNIISFIKTKQYGEIVLSGLGDVFLHKDLYGCIDYIFEELPEIKIYIMTKGQSIEKKDIERFGDYKKKGLKLDLTFSIFSLEYKRYRDVTGNGDLSHLLDTIKYASQEKINFNFEFFLDIHNISQIKYFKKFSGLFNKDFFYSIPHNWGGKLESEKYEKIFDEKILDSIIQRRKIGETCEAFSSDYLFFDYTGGVYKCGLKRFEKDLYLGNVGDINFSGDVDDSQYETCKNCSYYDYKTKLG